MTKCWPQALAASAIGCGAAATGARRGEDGGRGVIVQYVLMVLLAAFFLFPLVYMYVSSLKLDDAVLADGS